MPKSDSAKDINKDKIEKFYDDVREDRLHEITKFLNHYKDIDIYDILNSPIDREFNTPLHIVINNNRIESALEFIRRGANIDLQNIDLETSEFLLIMKGALLTCICDAEEIYLKHKYISKTDLEDINNAQTYENIYDNEESDVKIFYKFYNNESVLSSIDFNPPKNIWRKSSAPTIVNNLQPPKMIGKKRPSVPNLNVPNISAQSEYTEWQRSSLPNIAKNPHMSKMLGRSSSAPKLDIQNASTQSNIKYNQDNFEKNHPMKSLPLKRHSCPEIRDKKAFILIQRLSSGSFIENILSKGAKSLHKDTRDIIKSKKTRSNSIWESIIEDENQKFLQTGKER